MEWAKFERIDQLARKTKEGQLDNTCVADGKSSRIGLQRKRD